MIYFVTARELNRVKIGFSDEPRSRFVKMRTDSPVPLALERICDGDLMDEFNLHRQFAEHRLTGEWFTLSPEIEAHMGGLVRVDHRRKPRPLGGKLGEWLMREGVTLSTFAERIGTKKNSLSRFCSGKQELSFALIRAIVSETNGEVTTDDLIFGGPFVPAAKTERAA